MTTNIQLLRSGIAYKRPAAAPLLDGQAAINYNADEPGLFWRLTNGQLAKAGPVAITNDGTEPNSAAAGETGNSVGEEWLNQHPALHSPVLYIYNGTEFVTANGFTVDQSTGDFTLLRELEVTKIIAGSGQINGELVVGGNITPNGQNCAFYLGLPTERWDYFYGCNFSITYDGTIGRDLFVDRDATVLRDFTVGREVKSNLIPDVDATRYLGYETNRWLAHLSELYVKGNTQLGNSSAPCTNTLTVDALSTFNCTVDFNDTVEIDQIGTSCTDTLTIIRTTNIQCDTTIDESLTVGDGLTAGGTISLGTNCSSPISIKGTSTFDCLATFNSGIAIPNGDLTVDNNLIVKGNTNLGDSCTDTLTVNATATFKCPTTFESTTLFTGLATFNGGIAIPNGDLTVDNNLIVKGNTNLGDNCTDTLVVNATATFKCPATFDALATFNGGIDLPGNLTVGGNLIVTGDTNLGDSCTDTLIVNSTSTFKCPVTFEQPIDISQIGNSCTDTLTINATTTVKCPTTFEGTVKIPQIGTACTDTLTVNATTTFKCPVTFEQNLTGNIILGNGCGTSTINLNGAVTLSCDMMPNANDARSIGGATNRLKALYATDVYTGDLHLKNDKGDWTMIEAEDYLTIRNNKTGKTFRLLMEEV